MEYGVKFSTKANRFSAMCAAVKGISLRPAVIKANSLGATRQGTLPVMVQIRWKRAKLLQLTFFVWRGSAVRICGSLPLEIVIAPLFLLRLLFVALLHPFIFL